MGFPTALSSSEVDYLSTMQFASDCYILIWRQNIVFKARVNQSSFANTWAFIEYDNVADGFSFGDIKEGHTIWISSTDDIRAAEWWGRLRTGATSTNMSVEWNSFQPNDDDYIFVTKDVRESIKTPRLVGSNWLADYAISYHDPPPVIYNVPTFMLEVIDADGNADIAITPGAYAVASGATISSWALDTDGGTQISFNAATGAAVIRYTEPGNYMPRLTVTDSNANTQWFTPFVAIDNAELSSAIKFDFNSLSITSTVDNGWNMSMPLWDGVADVLDGSMCAVYMPHKTGGNKLLFCGRIRTESTTYTANGQGFVGFNVNGLAATMNNLNVISWRHKDTTTPDDFAEIKTLTLWRSIGAYIAIMTNINNTHSLQFDDITNDYQYLSYFYQKGHLLDSLREQMWSINYEFDFSSDGMLRLNRNMRFQTIAERDVLTNVANFEFKHYIGTDINDDMYSLEHDHSSQVGRATNGCGWYETSTNAVNFFAAISPPIQPGRGVEQIVTDRQILKSNQTRDDAETEGKRRVRNDFAAKQFLDTLNTIRISGGFAGKMNASVSDYYTNTITINDGIRRLTYDNTDKWLIPELSLEWDNVTGQVVINPTFQIESEDLGFAISIKNPAPVTPYNTPVLMPEMPFPTMPHNPAIDLPTGAQDGDEQPIDKDDVSETSNAQDPSTILILDGVTVAIWNDSNISMTRTFANLTGTTWIDSTPASVPGANTIKQFVWDRAATSQKAGYAISSNSDLTDPDTRVYRNDDMGTNALWLETQLTDMIATMINATSATGVIVYGKFEEFQGGPWSIDQLNGNGTDFLSPSSLTAVGGSAHSQAAGVYNSGDDSYDGVAGSTGGFVANIQFNVPPGASVSSILVGVIHDNVFPGAGGEDQWVKNTYNGTTLVSGAGTQTANRPGDGVTVYRFDGGLPATPGDTYLIHVSIRSGTFVKIHDVQINGTSVADYAGTRFSNDNGQEFEAATATGLMDLGEGSMTRRLGQRVLATKNEQVRRAPLAGQPFLFDADQGSTTSQFAKALLKFGIDDDYLLAPDGGSVGLYKIISNVRTDITPNDGASDGVVVGVGGLAVSSTDTNNAWFLGDFGGTKKLAYTTNLQGATTWDYTTGFSTSANWVSVNPPIYRSLDGGATVTAHNSPIGTLTGVEPL
jgi:hypothetical protein